MSIPEAEDFVDSIYGLSPEHKIHLKTLLDRGAVVPSAVIGRTPLWENA
jgi:hypothetical protein